MLPKRKNSPSTKYDVLNYSSPKLHEGKKWFVDFFQVDPVTRLPRRKKIHVDGAGTTRQRRQRAQEIIASLNERLRRGWNVWAESEKSREYTLLDEAFSIYLNYISRSVATGSMKKKSGYAYTCFCEVFRGWLGSLSSPATYCYELDTPLISDFLDYVLVDRKGSARTRNNYRGWVNVFCAWMVEKGYLRHNPVERISNIREGLKIREAISECHLRAMSAYLQKHDPHFLLACMMEYYTFIRPGELSAIRLENIDIDRQRIFVPGAVSKNRRDGMVAINDKIVRVMVELGIFNHPSHFFLFGADFKPSERKRDSRIFRLAFSKLRRQMKWPVSYQFYSLKDSGIRDLANSVGIVVARDQARHQDVATTNRYLKGDSMTVHEETKHFDGAL